MTDAVYARRRWVVGGLLAYAGAAAVIVLLPIGYSDLVNALWVGLQGITGLTGFGSGWVEFAANILLFLPLGFLLTLLFRHPWYGVILAVVLSAAVEIVQIVIPARQPSLRDVLANSLGAAVGAFFAWIIVLRRRRSRASASGERSASHD